MTLEETAILGCALQWPDESLPFLTEAGIRADTFSHEIPSLIFTTIATAWLAKAPGGFIGIATALGDRLADVGGAATLQTAIEGAAQPVTLPHYAEIVKEGHAKRRLALALKAAYKQLTTEPTGAVLAAIEAEISSIAAGRDSKRIASTKEIVMSVLGSLNKRTDGSKMAGLSTGIVRLDEETGGIRTGGYWVIAGPTKGGKSALVRYIVRAVALDQAKPVLVFGLEMSSDDTVEAMLATEGKVSASRMRDGTMHDMDFPKLTAAANNLALAPIYFRDDVYDLAGIRSYVRQVKAIQPDLAVVVVDYLQLTEGAGSADRREQEIAIVSKALRRMAKDENLAVIALAQLNDDGELRECRAIGMDATVQVTIEMCEEPGARLLRLRQRQGKTGVAVPVSFNGETFEWHPLAHEPEQASGKAFNSNNPNRKRK